MAEARDHITSPPGLDGPGVIVLWSNDRPCTLWVALPLGGLTLGRELLAQLGHDITDDRISRRHAHVSQVDDRFAVADLGSRNGTFAAGKAITDREQLVDAPCVIRTGRTVSVIVTSMPVAARPPTSESNTFGGDTTRVDDSRAYALAYNADGTGVDTHMIVKGLPEQRDAAIAAGQHGQHLLIVGERGTGTRAIAECYANTRDSHQIRIDGGAWRAPYPLPNGALTLHLSNPLQLPAAAQQVLLDQLARRPDLRVVTRNQTALDRVDGFSPLLATALSAARVDVPPLRDRPAALVAFVIDVVRAAAPGLQLHATLIETCLLRPWPGNYREIRERLTPIAVDLVDNDKRVFRGEDLPLSIGYPSSSAEISIGGTSLVPAGSTDPRRRRDSTKPDVD